MYTMETTLGELFDIPQVMEFLKKVAPQMVEGPAVGYMTPLSLATVAGMQPGMDEMAQAILDVANGKGTDFVPVDPRTQKPVVVVQDNSIVAGYGIDDVDGKLYMLDHRFSGCIVVQFSKEINPDIPGSITYQGEKLDYFIDKIAIAGNMQMIGIFVRNICTQYHQKYVLHMEGFTDMDGNVMDPCDYSFSTLPQGEPDPAYAANDAVALQAAEEGIVLLKNENDTLPLAKDATLALYGATDFRMGAVGAGKINPRYSVRLGRAMEESTFTVSQAADTCVFVISRASGENYDNGAFPGEYYLTQEEEQLIQDLTSKYEKTVAIINSGYPMDIRFLQTYGVDAAIWCGFPGMLGGTAVVNILNGTVNPSGKLPDTWSLDYYDIPSSKNFYMPETPEGALDADHDVWVDTVYEEDIYVGYRYFETFGKEVAYPFGYGLSYTKFNQEALQVDVHQDVLKSDAAGQNAASLISLTLQVTNQGTVAGKDVLEIYAAIPDGKLEQPAKRLVAFDKTQELAFGESQKLTLEIPVERFTSYDEEQAAFVMEAGTYQLYLGASVQDVKEIGSFTLDSNTVVKSVGDYMTPPVAFTRLSKKDDTTYPQGKLSGIIDGVHELVHKGSREKIADLPVDFGTIGQEVDSWSIEELARFSVCASSGWGMQDVGVAGRVSRLEGRDIPYYAVSDGNNGVNINKPNIGMPTSNLVCATWNSNLAYQVGEVIAKEAKENDVRMILAPAMNIHRNPLCGRHPEYFSEDPYLAGIMAGNQCKGLEENGMASSVKHVCCNNSEATRKRNHSILSKRALREIYLRAFFVAFEVQKPASIMTGYNACNGVFTAADEEMIQGIFRREYGLEGYVMTDWNSYDTADVAQAVAAGNCWMTPGTTDSTYTAPIIEGIKNGTISESRLRQNVKYMLRVIRNI